MHNVLELLQQKGISTQKASSNQGGEYHSPCPGCGGDDRFHVWPEQNAGEGSWWCRQCGKGGDNIQFLIEFDGQDYKGACRALDKELQPDQFRRPKLPTAVAATEFTPAVHADPAAAWCAKAEKFVEWCHQALMSSRSAGKVLRARGIEKKTWQKYRLGWNAGREGKDLFRPREAWGLETEMKGDRKKKLWLPRGLTIPLLSAGGDVRRIRIRRAEEKPPPYYVIPGSNMDCMVINPDRRVLVVVESELDAVLIDQEAGAAAGAVALGNSSRKPDAAAAFALKKASLVLVALDHDDAGRRQLSWWLCQYPTARHWPVPVGKDPGEAHLQGVNLKDWITAAYPPAWMVDESLLGQRPESVVMDDNSQKNSEETLTRAQGVPAAVAELAALLRAHPVRIRVTDKSTRIHEAAGWAAKNWEISKRISELVYFNSEVFDYIEGHPDEVIGGQNILQTKRGPGDR